MNAHANPTRQKLRRWLGGFRAAQVAERRVARQEGAQAARAIRLALSMIEAVRVAGVPVDPLRERDVGRVRRTWRRLRKLGGQPWQHPAGLRS